MKGIALAVETFRKMWRNEYVQTGIMIAVIIGIVFGFWYGSQLVLNTQYPALAVASGSMCTVKSMRCDGWDHPFSPTLHKGDLIIIQGVDPDSIQDTYPNSDIIVFHEPKSSSADVDSLIVHRVIAKEKRNGLTYFRTKGDGNGRKWPEMLEDPEREGDMWQDYRGENYTWDNMISEKLLVGKVIMRVPWIGRIALYMRNSSGMYLIIILIIILVIVEFIFPMFSRGNGEAEQQKEVQVPTVLSRASTRAR